MLLFLPVVAGIGTEDVNTAYEPITRYICSHYHPFRKIQEPESTSLGWTPTQTFRDREGRAHCGDPLGAGGGDWPGAIIPLSLSFKSGITALHLIAAAEGDRQTDGRTDRQRDRSVAQRHGADSHAGGGGGEKDDPSRRLL